MTVAVPGGIPEDCNGLDDDCNGRVDDIELDAPCSNDVGACMVGRLGCEAGVRTCVGGVEPSDETCDTIDNDCDGTVDEDTVPADELCDGRDNDCDMSVDEDVGPDQWEGDAGNMICSTASALGTIPGNLVSEIAAGDEEPRSIVGQIANGMDGDYYHFDVNEVTDFGNQFAVRVNLSEADPNLEWTFCIRILTQDANLNPFAGPPSLDEACQEAEEQCLDVVNGAASFEAVVNDRLARSDDTRVVIRVSAPNAAFCSPYRISYEAETL
jgi:hypothetical protein